MSLRLTQSCRCGGGGVSEDNRRHNDCHAGLDDPITPVSQSFEQMKTTTFNESVINVDSITLPN